MRHTGLRRMLGGGAVMVALAAAGCSSVEITLPEAEVIEEITFHSSLDVSLDSMTQVSVEGFDLYIEELEEGTGDAAAEGNTVGVDFSGFLATRGRQFTLEQGVGVILGVGEVPLGLDHAIRGMRPGGMRRAVVPPELGYGRVTQSSIPGGSVLVYEIQLNEVFDNS